MNVIVSDSCLDGFSYSQVNFSVEKFWQNHRIQNNFIINRKIVYPNRQHFSLKLVNMFDTLQQQTKIKKKRKSKKIYKLEEIRK